MTGRSSRRWLALVAVIGMTLLVVVLLGAPGAEHRSAESRRGSRDSASAPDGSASGSRARRSRASRTGRRGAGADVATAVLQVHGIVLGESWRPAAAPAVVVTVRETLSSAPPLLELPVDASGRFSGQLELRRSAALFERRALSISAEAPGMRSTPAVRSVRELRDGGALALRLELAAEIVGRVVSDDGLPVPDAVVRIHELPQSPRGVCDEGRMFTGRQRVSTSQAGDFRAFIRPGRARIWVRSAESVYSTAVMVSPAAGERVDVGDLAIPGDGATVHLRVVDPHGDPVVHAGAYLSEAQAVFGASDEDQGVADGWHLQLDEQGRGEIRAPASVGRMELALSAPWHETVVLWVDVACAGDDVHTVVLRPLPRVRVEFRGEDGGRGADLSALAEIAKIAVRPDAGPASAGRTCRVVTIPPDAGAPERLVEGGSVRSGAAGDPGRARTLAGSTISPAKRARAKSAYMAPPVWLGDACELPVDIVGPRCLVTVQVPGLGRAELAVLPSREPGATSRVEVPVPELRRLRVALDGGDRSDHSVRLELMPADGLEAKDATQCAPAARAWTASWESVRVGTGQAAQILVPAGCRSISVRGRSRPRPRRGAPPAVPETRLEIPEARDELVVRADPGATSRIEVALAGAAEALPLAGACIELEGPLDTPPRSFSARTNEAGVATFAVGAGRYRVTIGSGLGRRGTVVDCHPGSVERVVLDVSRL